MISTLNDGRIDRHAAVVAVFVLYFLSDKIKVYSFGYFSQWMVGVFRIGLERHTPPKEKALLQTALQHDPEDIVARP